MAGRALVGLLAVLTITTFTLAAIFDTFAGDVRLLEAGRFEDLSKQEFFARFDLTVILSVSLVLGVALALAAIRKLKETATVLIILPVQILTILLPKNLVDRPRPPGALEGASDSFPSGTAVTSMLVLGLLIYFIGLYVAPRGLRFTLQLSLGALIVTAGIFRVFANEHWPSDVVGGYMVGVLALAGLVWVYKKMLRSKKEPAGRKTAFAGGD